MDYDSFINGDPSAPDRAGNVETGPPWPRPSGDLLGAFGKHPVANIGDAQSRLGMPDGGLTPVWDGCRAVGSALTVLTVAGDNLAVLKAVSHIKPGDFVVINGFGYQGRALLGDVLAQHFISRGAVGAIVDGAVRDRDELRRQGFPVWARAITPGGPWKNGPGSVGNPVAIGGVVINSGDIVVADSDGIVAIPPQRAREVATELSQIVQAETRMRTRASTSASVLPPTT